LLSLLITHGGVYL
jgi:hypothetical protein